MTDLPAALRIDPIEELRMIAPDAQVIAVEIEDDRG